MMAMDKAMNPRALHNEMMHTEGIHGGLGWPEGRMLGMGVMGE